jgi:beta-phosphoglucomutase-like phosphatase (HAD superfamily)
VDLPIGERASERPLGGLIIYDFDGVIADSEVLANDVLAEIVTELGVPTTLMDSYRLYMGKRFGEVVAAVERSVGRKLPLTFASEYQARTLGRFRQELRLVDGERETTSTRLRMYPMHCLIVLSR